MTTNIEFFGNTSGVFFDAFNNADVQFFSAGAVRLVDSASGFITTFQGPGFTRANTEIGAAGTINSFSITTSDGAPVLDLRGVAWSTDDLFRAVVSLNNNGNNAPLADLLSRDDIVFDAAQSVTPLNIRNLFSGVTSDITITTSLFNDTLTTGLGDDTILSDNAPGGGDFLIGSGGSDTYDFRGATEGEYGEIAYFESGAVTINIDGDTGTVVKAGAGTDTLLGLNNLSLGDGFFIQGSFSDDQLSIRGTEGSFVLAMGLRGTDSYDITLDGFVRLAFDYGGGEIATEGADINVATGVIANDGHGNAETLSITDGNGRLEVRGTSFDDRIIGSERNENFILKSGNDTLDGGDGVDRLRFDRNSIVEGVNVDLAAGTAQGAWNGEAFSHTFTGIEEVNGSRFGNDVLRGGIGDESLRGGGGDDSLFGGDGSDFLSGWFGDDYLNPGDNDDFDDVNPHSGNDTVDARDMENGFLGIHHFNLAAAGPQVITIDASTDTGIIDKGAANGVTTILGTVNAATADGLAINASHGDDTITLTSIEDGFISFRPGRGDDTIVVNGSDGIVRIGLDRDGEFVEADQGAVVDLAGGVITNDGFGDRDTLDVAQGVRFQIRATNLGDSLRGGDDNDIFIPRGGNDTVDGGDGTDIVRYDRLDMTSGVEVDLRSGVATGVWDGVAFTDTLSRIEDVRGAGAFDNVLIGNDSGNALRGYDGDDYLYGDGFEISSAAEASAQMFRMYQATFDRAPDKAGHEGWVRDLSEGSFTINEVAGAFVGSREFQNTYGDLGNTDFVELLYQNVLGRASDAGGLQSWLDVLGAGGTRADVVLGFSDSREFVNATLSAATAYTAAGTQANWLDEVFRVYRATLDRDPDQGGLLDWTGNLSNGTALVDVIAGFTGSREFTNTYGDLDDAAFVELLYRNVLDRASDADGAQGWLDVLAAGGSRADVVLGFSESQEFIRETVPQVAAWVSDQGLHDELKAGGGSNVLTGGILSDAFVFAGDETEPTRYAVKDFEVWDMLVMDDFGFDTRAEALAAFAQTGADAVLTQGAVTVTLENTQVSALTEDMFSI